MHRPTWSARAALVAALAAVGLAMAQGDLVLDLDTLEATMDGTTLHASELAGAQVGSVTEELFLAIVVGDATEANGPRPVRGYLCDDALGVWMDGEVRGDELTLASDDGAVRIEGTVLVGGDVYGVAYFGEVASRPFTAGPARGDAGLYRADARVDGEDRTAGWVVLEGGRQRGSLDGKGNDVYLPPARN